MKKLTLVVDHELCWGCRTCELACNQEYDHKHKFIYVSEDGPKTVDGKLDFGFHANVCVHCEDPPCAEACPEEAITKREDGIVVLDSTECNGCELCLEQCDYNAIAFDPQTQTASKCNLCHHRVDQGLIPACADNVCLAHCIYFGDPAEIDSAIKSRKERLQSA